VPRNITPSLLGRCVIRGCVPKKLMWYASAFAEEHRDAQGFGWGTDKPKFDIKTLMAKKVSLDVMCSGGEVRQLCCAVT
jgi:pyruvate/2-oxoglutarate dehydrogenase complex dihydrolipoamide dehydrogenase (E3) component